MKKSEAIALFGSVSELAAALSVTRQAIYQWDEALTDERRDRVLGAAVRLGILTVCGPGPEGNDAAGQSEDAA